jgi:ADP-heptose:LPS heptosyltransferase
MQDRKSKILVKLEGGLGDCLLSNRFLPAIIEKHPNSEIYCGFEKNKIYSDESFQTDVLSFFYGEFYKEFIIFDEKTIDNYDYFYNLHIDKMDWTKYDFDWLSRFYYFPKPKVEIEKKDFVCVHLTHNKWAPKNLNKNYITNLVNELINVHPNIAAVCTETEKESFSLVKDKIEIVCSDIISACKTVAASKALITIDSGFKYIAYAYGVPTIETADYYLNPGTTHPMIKSRWLPFCERGLPLYCDERNFSISLKNILENKIASLFPLASNIRDAFKL